MNNAQVILTHLCICFGLFGGLHIMPCEVFKTDSVKGLKLEQIVKK